jgi:hypothetical protein
MPQFELSLTDDARVIIYNDNMFIIEATGGSMSLRFVLHILFFYLVHYHIVANNSTMTKAREKLSADLDSLDFLLHVWLNLKTVKFYLIKLAIYFY